MGFFKEVVMELIITCQTSPATLYYVLKYSQHNSSMQNHNNFFLVNYVFSFSQTNDRTYDQKVNSIKTEGNINMVLLNVWQHSLGLTTISFFGVRSKLSKSAKKPGHLIKLQRLYSRQHFVDSYYVIKLQLIINSCFFFSYYVSIIFLLCPQRL